ncbi:MAG: hypothetical protein P1U74_09135 [Legionellaceae bacterium]|nr:hypothetical protein [Legionellaceae bacterium]
MPVINSQFSSQIINILNDLDDLGIKCSIAAKNAIANFYIHHYTPKLCTNKLMYIILGLVTLHDIAEDKFSPIEWASAELLKYLYLKDELSLTDLNLIAYALSDFRNNGEISPSFENMIIEEDNLSAWMRGFVDFIKGISSSSKLQNYKSSDTIISRNYNEILSLGDYQEYRFGYYEKRGLRRTQEDALTWAPIDESELNKLTNQEIGKRLWTTYHNLNEICTGNYTGTTASTTICTRDALITATLSDTIAFAIVYEEGNEFEVYRLNKLIRHPNDKSEEKRIIKAGGFVKNERVQGDLSPPRVIGDKKITGVCADADIDIFDLNQFPKARKIQLITACDGFTEPLVYEQEKEDTKSNCEYFLRCYLNAIAANEKKSLYEIKELDISKLLAEKALQEGSEDNISISVQTVRQGPFYFVGMTGIYDGHGGHTAAHFVAGNIVGELNTQLRLTQENYDQQKNSVTRNMEIYNRDHDSEEANFNYKSHTP